MKGKPPKKLLDQIRDAIRAKHYSRKIEPYITCCYQTHIQLSPAAASSLLAGRA